MGLGDFWLQSNDGKKYNLKDLKDLKPEDIAKNPKLQKFIKLFDFDNSGTIEIKNKDGQNEWKSIFTELQQAAIDNDLSEEEFGNYVSQKLLDEDLNIDDINELLDIASQKSESEEVKQVGNKTITTVDGRVIQVVTDLGNGQSETTLYEYVEATENNAAHVILTTIKGKDHISLTKVIDVDENGNYDDNQFIYRQIRTVEDGEPTLITIGKNQNGQILEQKNKVDKTIVNIYNESHITEFDKNNSERLYQEIKYSEDESYNAFYDGQGNTYLPVKNGEEINTFLSRVNKELRKLGQEELTIEDLGRLNPKVNLNNLKVANPYTGDTGMLLISGTHDADSSLVKGSGTVAENAQAQANDALRKAVERVNNKDFKNHTLTKTYTSFEALAKDLSVDVLELMVLNQSSTSVNGLVALTKGATIRVPVELTSSDTPEMIIRAFPLSAQNRIFYQRYNVLDENQKRNVLNVVRSMQGKSAKEIKDAILNYYPDINLFDSGLTVPINNAQKLRSMPAYQTQGKSNIVSLETFITDYLKLDLRSEKGQIVYKRLLEAVQSSPIANLGNMSFGVQAESTTTDEERYIQAVQTNLNQLSASDFQDCSKMDVHQILELLFNAGIPRTQQENEIRQSQLERNPLYQQKKREEFAADVLYNMMKQASDILHQYCSQIGYLSGDAVWQGLKIIANYATFGNVETIWKEMDKLDEMVAKVEQLRHAPNHVEFEKLFKEFTSGMAFDNDKMQKLIDVTIKVGQGELADDSPEYLNAFKEAFGTKINLDIVADTQKSVSEQQTKGSICDIVMMLTALGNVGKLAKAKQFSQWALGALGKYGGSALVGATNLAGWTAIQKGTNLLTREAGVTSEDLKEYGWEIVQSAGFGATGGIWGNLAVSRVMGWTDKVVGKELQKFLPKAVEKHMAKVATKVSDLFKTASSSTASAATKSGIDVMLVAAKTPGKIAQGVGFLTEVAGFTGYQTIVDTSVSMIQQGGVGIELIQNVLIQKAELKGELNDEKLAEIKNMSYMEAMLNLLVEESSEQLQSLGTIKGVEAAMKFIMSGRIGMVADATSFQNCKTLKDMKIKSTSVDGKSFYEITMPDGKKMVANNEQDLIAFCNQQMQIDILTNLVTEKLKKEGVDVSGVALVKTMGADRATVGTAREGRRTSNLQIKPINIDGQIKYEITDASGAVRTVDKVIDVINTTQTALAIDKIESVVNKQLKNSLSITAKSLLKLVMSKDTAPIQINGIEVKPSEILENSSVLESWKISKTTVDGNEVYTLTMDNGKIVNINSLESVINLCENRFRFAIIEKIALENPDIINIPSGKLNDVAEASSTNPAAIAEARIREEWTTQDVNTKAPELGEPAIILKDGKFIINENLTRIQFDESVPNVTDEVTSLIFKGKLGEILKTQYENAGKVFEEVITKNTDKITKLEAKYANNKEQLAIEFTKLLAKELGVKGIEPKIKFDAPKNAGAAGYFNWTTGELLINQELTNPKDIETIIAHEFVHVMQFKDIISAKGQDGVREIYLKNNSGKYVEEQTRELLKRNGIDYNSLTPQEQAEYRDATADILAEQTLELNAGLTKYAKNHPLQKGSLNEYLTRIYQAENKNMAIFDTPEYYSQLIENEAYFLGNGKLGGKIKEGTKLPIISPDNNRAKTTSNDNSLKIPAGKVDEKTNELIRKYNALVNKRDLKGLSQEEFNELLSVTFELQELGFRQGNNKRLDFEWNVNSENIPNLGMTKTELRNKLSIMGISASKIEMIENNANRINLDLLNAMNPKLIEEYGSSILIDFEGNGDNVSAKIEIANLLESNSMIPTREKGLLISGATKDNLTNLKQKINTIEQNLNYLKTCGVDESIIDFYARIMCKDRSEFSKELFEAIKDNKDLINSDICFNVPQEDVPYKIEIFNALKGTETSPEMMISFVRSCNKNNIEKMRIIESLRNDENNSLIELMYQCVDNFTTEQVNVIKQNPALLKFYDARAIAEIPAEDIAAKNEILSLLDDSKLNVDLCVRRATKDNLEQCKHQINYLTQIEKVVDMPQSIKSTLIGIVINSDIEILGKFLDAIKEDYSLIDVLTRTGALECKTKEEAQQKAEIYEMIKDLTDPYVKASILGRVQVESVEQLKQNLVDEIPIITKINKYNNLQGPQFSQQESVVRVKILNDVKQELRKALPSDVNTQNEIFALFENAKNIEELMAKHNVLKNITAKHSIECWTKDLLKEIKIKEQADLAVKLNLSSEAENILGINFAQVYKQLMKLDVTSNKPLPSNINYLVKQFKTPEDFERFITVFNDKTVRGGKDFAISSSPEKFALYQQFIQSPIAKSIKVEVYNTIMKNISEGVYKDSADLSKALNEVKLVMVRDVIAKYNKGEIVMAIPVVDTTDFSSISSKPEKFIQTVEATFPNVDIAKLREQLKGDPNDYGEKAKDAKNGLAVLGWIIKNAYSQSFEEIGNNINNTDLHTLSKRNSILIECSPDVAYKLAFCPEAEFNKIASILEKRPEILLNKYDKVTFDKLINMSDADFETLKIPLKERPSETFDAGAYSRQLDTRLNRGFTLDLSTWQSEERKRLQQVQSVIGKPIGNSIPFDESRPLTRHNNPVTPSPTVEQLMTELEQTGRFSLSIADEGGMNPALTDPAIVHESPEELGVFKSTKTSVNIGETRIWDRDRLARDLLQNFYDGNGYTLEGVSIDVVKKGDKYAVTISGKGMFDYQRVLDFGAHSTADNASTTEAKRRGANPDDSRRAGKYGEGSKVLTGNLICNYGSDYVRYRCGDWVLDLILSEPNEIGEVVINKRVTKAPQRLEGTTYEFETNDIELIKSLAKAKDYFYSPTNKDFANFDFENEFFGIKLLPEGEKGNLYIVQRYEVDGQQGFDNTLDGISIVFKRQPYDEELTKANDGKEYDIKKLGTGRNRVGLTKETMKELIERYATTFTDEQLIQVIGSMKKEFLLDSESPNKHILEGFIEVANKRNLKIDFGHHDYLAVAELTPSSSVESARRKGKILVVDAMKGVGIPTIEDYIQANTNETVPELNLTPVEEKKLMILEEAVKTFSSYLDLENYEIITDAEASKPKYVVEEFASNNEKGSSTTVARAIINGTSFEGHWIQREYLNNGDFFDLLATWLHENSHKIGGDGSDVFNQRLIKLQQLVVDISNTHPDFCEKLSILYQKFNEVSGKSSTQYTAPSSSVKNIILAEMNKKLEQAANRSRTLQYIEEHPEVPVTEIEGIRELYSPQMQRILTDLDRRIDTYKKELKEALQAEEEAKKFSNRIKTGLRKFLGVNRGISPSQRVHNARLNLDFLEKQRNDLIRQAEAKRKGENLPEEYIPREEVGRRYISPLYDNLSNVEKFAPTPDDNMATLLQNGSVTVDIPTTANTKPKISNSSILAADRATLGIPETIPLLADYNSSQEWSTDVVARDIMQNFYDGHGGTLDGIKIEVKKVDGKYKVKISGNSEYNYFYLETIGASGGKTQDVRTAGGFGEGAKMACKTMLGQGVTEKITFASGDWTFDFELEQGVSRSKQHVTRVLNKNQTRVNGTYVEFETTDECMVESILKAKDYFKHSENADFTKYTAETDRFAFRILKEGERGNLYYIQRYAIKGADELEGALDGIQIIFKEQLTAKEKAEIGLSDDCDRRGFTGIELRKISKVMARSMSNEQLLDAIQNLERYWVVTDLRQLQKNPTDYAPEQQFALGLIDAAKEKGLKFKTDGLKFVAADMYRNDNDNIKLLVNHGYKIVVHSLSELGFPSIRTTLKNVNQIIPVSETVLESQKLALIKDLLLPNSQTKLKIFEASDGNDKVSLVREGNYIAIDRQYLKEVDFNTLYTQVWSQMASVNNQMDWGYEMTNQLGVQLHKSSDPIFMAKFNAYAKKFNELDGSTER